MLDVLFISMRPYRRYYDDFMALSPPLGLGYLSLSLSKNSISSKILDMYLLNLSDSKLLDEIKKHKPKLIGFHVYTESIRRTLNIAKKIKELLPKTHVVLGGPHAAFCYAEILKNDFIDAVLLGEADKSIISIFEEVSKANSSFARIRGVASILPNGSVVKSQPDIVKDLDSLSFPDRALFVNAHMYVSPSTSITSRGCPGKCIFCGGPGVLGKEYRGRSSESIIEEMKYLSFLYPEDPIIFWDDAFTIDETRLFDLCSKLNKYNWKWTCGMRVDKVNREIIKVMKSAGCIKINIGAESGDDRILESIGKGITTKMIQDALEIINNEGINVSCSFLIPNPEDTTLTISKTIEFAKDLYSRGAAACTFNALTPFPGTYIYENREKYGISIISNEWDDFFFQNPVFITSQLSIRDIRNYLFKATMLWATNASKEIDKKFKLRKEIREGNLRKRRILCQLST